VAAMDIQNRTGLIQSVGVAGNVQMAGWLVSGFPCPGMSKAQQV
jgi:hypothetical protein